MDSRQALIRGMQRGYIEAFFFADTGEEGQPPHDAALSESAESGIFWDCEHFVHRAAPAIWRALTCEGYSAEQAGRDFYFTRNGHGVGFWDRPELPADIRDVLTEWARLFGPTYAWVDRDGSIDFD